MRSRTPKSTAPSTSRLHVLRPSAGANSPRRQCHPRGAAGLIDIELSRVRRHRLPDASRSTSQIGRAVVDESKRRGFRAVQGSAVTRAESCVRKMGSRGSVPRQHVADARVREKAELRADGHDDGLCRRRGRSRWWRIEGARPFGSIVLLRCEGGIRSTGGSVAGVRLRFEVFFVVRRS